jgi:hypothetical protein
MLKYSELLFKLFQLRERRASRCMCLGEMIHRVARLGNGVSLFFKVQNPGPQMHPLSSPLGGVCRVSW